MGVAMFLMLSIFLLMGALDNNPNLLRYFRRRITRIWPLYFGTCMALFVLFDHNVVTLIWNLSFLAVFNPSEMFVNTVRAGWPATYVVWTLQLEEWAYLCFPLIALLSHRNRLVVGMGLLFFAGVLYGTTPGVSYFVAWPWIGCYGFGLLAYETRLKWESAGKWSLIGLGLGFLVPWPWGLLCVGPSLAWVIAYPPAFLRHTVLVYIGECSYALYLVHLLFLEFFGFLGIPMAYASAWCIESFQRGKEMRRRVGFRKARLKPADRREAC